ncbi:MAG: DUF2309 family protein, partial [Acidobacteria bacterium]|nr:DUF2309 family protein [Acidobacteriota bacterium]
MSTFRDKHAKLTYLEHVIAHAAHLLPAQGPIRVFIHHNTLHAFEDLPFEEAVQKGARLFGCHPYLPEDRYREKLARGRIRVADLEAVLREDLGNRGDEPILRLGARLELRLAMLLYPLRLAPTAELRWFVARTDALTCFRDAAPPLLRETFIEETRNWIMRDLSGESDKGGRKTKSRRDLHLQKELARLLERFGERSVERWSQETWETFTLQVLWRICRDGVHGVKISAPQPLPLVRHRDFLLAATGQDSDLLVHEVLIRFCAAFLDQGFCQWPLPYRERGFYQAFCALYRLRGGPPDRWLCGLSKELTRIEGARLDPQETLLESLQLLGVPDTE